MKRERENERGRERKRRGLQAALYVCFDLQRERLREERDFKRGLLLGNVGNENQAT